MPRDCQRLQIHRGNRLTFFVGNECIAAESGGAGILAAGAP
jgi:hypothetical protein